MPKKSAKSNVDDEYDMLGDVEHVIHRPSTYVGSTNMDKVKMWIRSQAENGQLFTLKEIKYVPAFYKIFDEVLMNARDHFTRCKVKKLEACTSIKVDINPKTWEISIWNNGAGIPIEMHSKHKMLVPEMIFGHLRSSSNFNDNEKRTVGGVNGYGAKLANIFSTKFEVETVDANVGKKFYQCFEDNMSKRSKPKVTSAGKKKPYTKISFVPDLEKFKMKKMSSDVIALFEKRVYDVAMNCGANVYYNGAKIEQNRFEKYVEGYFPEGSDHKKAIDVTNKNWRVAVIYDPDSKLEPKESTISFVNGICTSRGGTHVEYVTKQIIDKIKEGVAKKVKGADVKNQMIKDNLIFFIDCVIENPDFDTQTKECMTNKVKSFGSKYVPPETFLKKILKTGVIDQIVEAAKFKAQQALNRSLQGKRVDYPKLEDAHDANRRKGDCTLFLTEGDSAASIAREGVAMLGKKKYGIYPLRGKVINVRDKSEATVAGNREAEAVARIIGLEHGVVYESTDGLRYSRVVVFTDQDNDGFHIKGLVINYIHYFWPSLLKLDFIQSFATPVIKVVQGKKTTPFYSLQEFSEWEKKNNSKSWKANYYKGLGTSTKAEAKEYFKTFSERLVSYKWEGRLKRSEISEDSPYVPRCKDLCEDSITLLFDKNRAADRREWMKLYDPKMYIDSSKTEVSYHEFFYNEMMAYSISSVERAVASIVDGLKPCQRKILAACFKRNLKENVKLSQLAGYVGEQMAYHHGDQALNKALIAMAQDFVGTNNINLLVPDGQFGTRYGGGKDHAAPRYIKTRLSTLTRKIFREEDQGILTPQYEDGAAIEPVFFVPVVPMVLVNGCVGIATGYSTDVFQTDPLVVIDNCIRHCRGEKLRRMIPFFRNFTGVIEKVGSGKYTCRGVYTIKGDVLTITELPIGVWSGSYDEFLRELVAGGVEEKLAEKKATKKTGKPASGSKTSSVKSPPKSRGKGAKGKGAKGAAKNAKIRFSKKNAIGRDIKEFRSDSNNDKVLFTIRFQPGTLQNYVEKGTLESSLKLSCPLSTGNMHLFDENGKITKYDSYADILENFARVRLEYYAIRRKHLLKIWKVQANILSWTVKFMQAVIDKKIDIFRKSSSQVEEILVEKEYPKFIKGDAKNPSYHYLTDISIISFTEDKLAELRKKLDQKNEDIAVLKAMTPEDIWVKELEELRVDYLEWLKETTPEDETAPKSRRRSKAE